MKLIVSARNPTLVFGHQTQAQTQDSFADFQQNQPLRMAFSFCTLLMI